MRLLVLAGALAISSGAAALACTSRYSESFDPDGGTSLDPDADGPEGPAGTGLVTGLPCDVQAILENRCIACHDGTRADVPRLLDYADLTAPSKSDPTKSMALTSVIRMKSATMPMPLPPAEPATEEEIVTFQDWVLAGTPKGARCTDPVGDAGPIDPMDVGDAGPDGGATCTSGLFSTQNNTKSPLMHPGGACNACHQQLGGPNLKFAGTVYRGLHDVDDCNGTSSTKLTVTITDKGGRIVDLPVNAAGNFLLTATATYTAPFRATVSDGLKVRSMAGTVTSGDCNSCHSAGGKNGAPGRILAP